MLKGLLYPIIYVPDIKTSVVFYCEMLGCDIVSEDADFAELRIGSALIALNKSNGITKLTGRQTLVLHSDNVAQDYARLMDKVQIQEPLSNTPYGPTFIFQDPSGTKIEVVMSPEARI